MKKAGHLLLAILLIYFLMPGFAVGQTANSEKKLYQKGLALSMQTQWEEAVVMFKTLLHTFPKTKYVDANYWIGHSYIEMQRYQDGIFWLEDFARRYPGNSFAAQALFEIGNVYEKHYMNYDKALAAYKEVVQLYPGKAVSLNASMNQAEIYAQQKMDYPQAQEQLKQSKTLGIGQGLSPKSRFIKEAESRINFLKKNSDYDYKPLRLFTMAQNAARKNKLTSAEKNYRMIIQAYPDSNISEEAHFELVTILYKQGKSKEADTERKKFARKYPNSVYNEILPAD
ncbi:MAG: tetratricopeptide repeat protein [Vulcanimicrobiota bacterium]